MTEEVQIEVSRLRTVGTLLDLDLESITRASLSLVSAWESVSCSLAERFATGGHERHEQGGSEGDLVFMLWGKVMSGINIFDHTGD